MNTSGTKTAGLIGTIAAVILQYGIFASAAVLVVLGVMFSGIDTNRGLSVDDARGCLTLALWSTALTVPTVILAFVRTGRFKIPIVLVSLVPPLGSLFICACLGVAVANLSKPVFTGTITHAQIVGDETAPARSIFGYDGYRRTITLPAGESYNGVPIVGPFTVDRDGKVLSGQSLRIAHDIVVPGVTCSAKGPVEYQVGVIRSCTPKVGTTVDGVPCRTDKPATFDGIDIGSRVDCVLAKSWRSQTIVWPAGTEIGQPTHYYTIGATPPAGVRLFGKSLPKDAIVSLWPGAAHVTAGADRSKWYCQVTTGNPCTGNDVKISPTDLTMDGKPLADRG